MKVAIYGKGGIGKSTVAANLSAALAESGCSVLQIGCDPKHDSTRLLLDGRTPATAMDYMRSVPPVSQRLDDLLHEGYRGVVCAEAGGPEPGVGCAGRGILSTFSLFERLGLRMDEFDVIIYDVLGDVVCGGFAVPLRKGFAEAVYVVTSEEFMALYAANNILRGVSNFDSGNNRLAGLVLNSRGREEDPAAVERFAESAGIPILTRIPRSEVFRKAEAAGRTLIQAFPRSPEADLLRSLAGHIRANREFCPASPLSDSELEKKVFLRKPRTKPAASTGFSKQAGPCSGDEKDSDAGAVQPPARPGLLSKSMLFREPLHGCAFTGAISTTTQVCGSVTVAHCPRSCAHIASRTVFSRGLRGGSRSRRSAASPPAPVILSSEMSESTVIYGGVQELRLSLEKALKERPEAVFLVTACPSGIIGDDPEAAIKEASEKFPGIPVIPVTTDGNIQGDYMQGVINACLEGAARLIDPSFKPGERMVNMLAEKNIAYNADSNYEIVSGLLSRLGIRVNCRFVRNAAVEDLRRFCRAGLNLLAYEDHFGRVLKSFFSDRYGSVFASCPFPVGFGETRRWLEEVASFFGSEDQAAELAEDHRQYYEAQVKRLRPQLEGKRLMIVSFLHDVDWILETAFDLGMKVEKVGILSYVQDYIFRTRFRGRFEWEAGYTPDKRDKDLLRIKPDLLLCNYVPEKLPVQVRTDSIPLCPDVGFYGGLAAAGRWAALLKSPAREGWRDDGYMDD